MLRSIVDHGEHVVAVREARAQAIVLNVVPVVVALEEVDKRTHVEGTHNRAALEGALALLDDLRSILVGRVHREALLQVRHGAFFLVLPVQGGADAVVPLRVSHALGLNAAQQLHCVLDVFLEGIHVRLGVVDVGARQQARQLVVHRGRGLSLDERDDLLVFLLLMEKSDLVDE